MRDTEHVSEIDRVLKGQETGRDELVSESWRRCVQTYGMDPTRPEPAHIVTEQQLREHQEQSERLIATARSGLRTLFKQVAGQNYVLLLADAKGICVDFFGDPRFEEDLRRAGLYLGSDWSEDLAGTCGVGSCIVTGEAVTIHQGDHFGLSHTPLSLHVGADLRYGRKPGRRPGCVSPALTKSQVDAEPCDEPCQGISAPR